MEHCFMQVNPQKYYIVHHIFVTGLVDETPEIPTRFAFFGFLQANVNK